MWSIERWFSDGFTVVNIAYVKVLLKNIIRRKDTSKAIKQKIKNTSSRSKQGKEAMPPTPSPVKISHKKDGHQRQTHRSHVSRPITLRRRWIRY